MKSPAPSRPQKMALIPACIFLCFAALSVQAEETPVTPQPPDILLGPLFNDAISLTSISPCRKRARNMFRQRGNHCANILTDFGRY